MGLMRKEEIKGKELRKGRGIKERNVCNFNFHSHLHNHHASLFDDTLKQIIELWRHAINRWKKIMAI